MPPPIVWGGAKAKGALCLGHKHPPPTPPLVPKFNKSAHLVPGPTMAQCPRWGSYGVHNNHIGPCKGHGALGGHVVALAPPQGGAPPPIKFIVCVGGGVGEFQCLVHPRGHPKLAMCVGGCKWPHGVHGVAHHVGAPLAPPSTHLAP